MASATATTPATPPPPPPPSESPHAQQEAAAPSGSSAVAATSTTTTTTTTARHLLEGCCCYDILPHSYKLIVLETTLLVKKGLAALLLHGVQSAPLWDATVQRFVGMFTVTDFINLLLYYHQNMSYDEALEQVENLTIRGLKSLSIRGSVIPPQTLSLHPMGSLLDACNIVLANALHRLPLVDHSGATEAIVSVVTQFQILRYIATNHRSLDGLDVRIRDIPLGVYGKLETASPDTPLVHILNLFVTRRISAVPIVDDQGVVLDVYEKYDVLMLSKEGTFFDLNMPVKEALALRSAEFEGVHTCTENDTLRTILEAVESMTIHRLFVIDEEGRLKGMISLSDILKHLVNRNAV
ncbi:hypothetical protein DFJ73DRAFT_221009 [Zopfochytrium polystomum]|nr:hypothetical protein DFJ73DRAFT_221009 [Zopfochytrium polystomum]